jgi:hypothetical protein
MKECLLGGPDPDVVLVIGYWPHAALLAIGHRSPRSPPGERGVGAGPGPAAGPYIRNLVYGANHGHGTMVNLVNPGGCGKTRNRGGGGG